VASTASAPLGSVIVPVISPPELCAQANAPESNNVKHTFA